MRRYIPVILFLVILLPGSLLAQADSTYELDDINFSGNENFSSSQLASQLTSQETPWWFWKFLNGLFPQVGKEPSYFDSLNIADDIQNLKAFYNRNGYLDADISASYELDSADKSASLTYEITEGPPFYIDNFRIRGISRLPAELSEDLYNEIHLDSGKIYSRDMVESVQSRIAAFLRNSGYMLASIQRPTIISVDTINYEENYVDVTTRVDLGRRYQLGDITVNKGGPGADLVDSAMIEDIAGLKPGEYYSLERTRRAQSRLSRTNLFSSVFVEPVGDTANIIMPMEIRGDVGLLNEAAPEFLVNNEENGFNVGLGFSYTRKNFFGQARKFTIGASVVARDILNIDYGNFFKSLSLRDTTLLGLADLRVTIEQPYLFSRPIYGTWDSYVKLNKQSEYNATTYGTKFSADIETPLYTYFNSLVAYVSYESAIYIYGESYIYNNIASLLTRSGQPVDEGLREYFRNTNNRRKTDNTSYLGIEAGANKSDNLLFPTKGYNLYLLLEEGNSLSYLYNSLASNDLNFPLFYKAMANASFYFDLYTSNVSTLAVKLKSGYIQAYHGKSSQIPLNRRLYAGGSNSVRGWPSRGLVPLSNQPALSIEDLGNQDLLEIFNNTAVIGGTFLFEGSVETRNRLFGDFGGALFLDFGNSWNGYKTARVDEIAVASGFGFRYYSPFGPIRMDFGFKTYDPSDKRWIFHKTFFDQLQFHIAIGEAF